MAKTKGAKGGNPSPVQTGKFLEKQFKPQGDLECVLATQSLCVRLPEKLDAVIRALPDRSAWLRKAIVEVAKKQGLY